MACKSYPCNKVTLISLTLINSQYCLMHRKKPVIMEFAICVVFKRKVLWYLYGKGTPRDVR